jgi:hypothetical protein
VITLGSARRCSPTWWQPWQLKFRTSRRPFSTYLSSRAELPLGDQRHLLLGQRHDGGDDGVGLLLLEVELRHLQELFMALRLAGVEDPGLHELPVQPARKGVRDLAFLEAEVQALDELAALFGQLGADRSRLLEPRHVVASEAPLAGNRLFPEVGRARVVVHCRELRVGFRHAVLVP